MKKIRLIKLLKTLSNREINQLGRFVKSPFFNSNQHIINLYEYLAPYHPHYEDMDKQVMFKKTFPDMAYESKPLNTLMWQFCKLMEDFFVMSELKASPSQKGKILKDNYRRRDLKEDYSAELYRLDDLHIEDEEISFEKSIDAIEVLHEILFQTIHKSTDDLQALDFPINRFEQHLLFIELYSKLNIQNIEKTFKRYKIDYIFSDFKEIKPDDNKYEKDTIKNNPLLNLSINLLKYNTPGVHTNVKDFESLINLFLNNKHLFSLKDAKKLYTLIGNAKQNFEKTTEIYKLFFPVTKMAIEDYLIGSKDAFSPFTFENIIAEGCAAEEYEYVAQFIEKKSILLPSEIRKSQKQLGLGMYHYYRNQYEDAVHKLYLANFTQAHKKLKVKFFIVRSYFELLEKGETEWISPLRAQIRSMDKYLKRTKKITYYTKASFEEITLLCKKLTARKTNINRTEKHQEELRDLLRESKKQRYSSWFAQKIDNLLD